jgi:acetoin utilization deacetylase AcuC-like enzyme
MAPGLFFSHPASLAHDTGQHPERALRMVAIERRLEEDGWLGFERRSSPAVDRALLERCHDPRYVAALERLCASGGGMIDGDTIVSVGSWEAALRSAGGAVAAVDALLDGAAAVTFAAGRPPGHHAITDRAMGFCLFNNVAIAALRALERGLERVLILDWDVHHGNGTNDIFHESAEVLYASIHESPLYPGTGPASDRGAGAGAGFTINMPVPSGSGDAVFVELVRGRVAAAARDYGPQLILISAGYDAHHDDPLASCEVTTAGYGEMSAAMRDLAAELDAPLGLVLEGGYALGALADSVAATLAVLAPAAGPAQDDSRVASA